MSSLIELKNIYKSYQRGEIKTPALQGVNLTIEKSELIGIIGTSGSGKSTLMNILGLLDKPTTGHYFLEGKDILETNTVELANMRNQMIGFVFQSFYLLPQFTILENVSLPLTYREMSDKEIEDRAHLCLKRVALDHLSYRYPQELSGGQQQRVAIARALVGNPSIILADEPTGSLDTHVGQEIMNLFIQLNMLDKDTIIIITHDPHIASQCQRIIHVQDGKIIQGK